MAYKNKEDQAKASRKHYLLNKDKIIDRSLKAKRVARKRNRKYVTEYLSTHPCIDCGESDLLVLDFDHVRDIKINNISDMVHSGVSLKALQIEIAKCEIRCANCHRRKTRKLYE